MDRIRTGLLGLCIVFLFTLTASVVFAPPGGKDQPMAPGEPLATLGVAPGSDKQIDSAAPPAGAPRGPEAGSDGRAAPGGSDGRAAPGGSDGRAASDGSDGRAASDGARQQAMADETAGYHGRAPGRDQALERPVAIVPDAALSAIERGETGQVRI
jgi:hypothetical protein